MPGKTQRQANLVEMLPRDKWSFTLQNYFSGIIKKVLSDDMYSYFLYVGVEKLESRWNETQMLALPKKKEKWIKLVFALASSNGVRATQFTTTTAITIFQTWNLQFPITHQCEPKEEKGTFFKKWKNYEFVVPFLSRHLCKSL